MATRETFEAVAFGEGGYDLLDDQEVTLIALPAIFRQFREQGKAPGRGVMRELLDMVKIYNVVPAEQEANTA